ncbi:MAG TPA: class I SAM-dependent methyltransferase [Actinoplanes sp.]
MSDYLEVNLANWNERAAAHAASPSYPVQRFADDPAYLSSVVQFDRALLGDITGHRGIHLQCHIGTDTVSLARLGAEMTGLDFSDQSLDQAHRIAALANAEIDFVQADVYRAFEAVGGGFDLVYTGIGALCWLPDVRRWARTVASLLRPGGRLFIRDCHPVLWSIDETRSDGALALHHPYFEHREPLIFDDPGTYVETEIKLKHTTTHSWNHGIGEIVTAVLEAGMTLTGLVEHTTVPWEAVPGRMHQLDNGEWQLSDRPERLPHTYTLQAVR